MLVLIGIVIIGWLVYRVPVIHKREGIYVRDGASGTRLFILFMTAMALGLGQYTIKEVQYTKWLLTQTDKYTAVLTDYYVNQNGTGKWGTTTYFPFYEFRTVAGDSIEYSPRTTSLVKPVIGSTYTVYYNKESKRTYVLDGQTIIGGAVVLAVLVISLYFMLGLLLYSIIPIKVRYRWVDMEMCLAMVKVTAFILIQLCICLLIFSGYHYSWAMIIVYLIISTYLTVRAFRTNIKEWIEEFKLR
ncbi:hypothetical protein HX071_00820 [Myroides marinus]|uniref:DUF3592 domain-containing protein n=1 Tax=Myroides marinus TaxID=703342 RepID=UPI002576841F|nr:DUF3592 domain-containing protein [Myroides marinus]MDM1360271.1 hypothetical protein [Myroides marinus]MDM1500746.1 hypothetical protein [Myroides marinus]